MLLLWCKLVSEYIWFYTFDRQWCWSEIPEEAIVLFMGTQFQKAADCSNPVSCEEKPPQIRFVVPARSTDAPLDWDLRNLEARATPWTLVFIVAVCIIPLKEATVRGEGGMCQIDAPMFPAEHWPEHHTPSGGLSSSHSASWCHHFHR